MKLGIIICADLQKKKAETSGGESPPKQRKEESEMKSVVFIQGRREGYATSQIRYTMTIGELIDYLQNFDEDAEVYLDNDNGYTFGSITEDSFKANEEYEEEE